jgi:hypothetical protein
MVIDIKSRQQVAFWNRLILILIKLYRSVVVSRSRSNFDLLSIISTKSTPTYNTIRILRPTSKPKIRILTKEVYVPSTLHHNFQQCFNWQLLRLTFTLTARSPHFTITAATIRTHHLLRLSARFWSFIGGGGGWEVGSKSVVAEVMIFVRCNNDDDCGAVWVVILTSVIFALRLALYEEVAHRN